ncbi:transporter [Solihabitans fulvus]|uniref:Transporter n=1 Tax=Solihabitans fulvus TaxID=1892852 RepID=A0A5B2XNT5_9PSEU|nr:transporter [Solihabitans fulvus]KAA2264624.1 transporter [Solihabitans fulvus]
MIWLTWRQHRKQALFTAIGLAVLAALIIPTGLAMRGTFDRLGLTDCVAKLGTAQLSQTPIGAGTCDAAFREFNGQYRVFGMIGVLFLFLPLVVGLFWGAPLVAREIEQGTHRLVWTQGISRRHWALVKFGMVGAATLVASALYGFGVSWWMTPLSQAGQLTRFDVFYFDMQGLAPIGYTLFAVALGVFAGTVWPKVLPAMAATLAGFVGVRVALTTLARPNYLPAETLTYPVQGAIVQPNTALGDWVLSHGVRDAAGKLVAANAEIMCPPNATGPGASCGADMGVGAGSYNWQLFQPGSRFWAFQGIETGIFLVLVVLLAYFAVRRIRRIS